MPLDIFKPDFFRDSLNLGTPRGLFVKSFLALNTDFYLDSLAPDGSGGRSTFSKNIDSLLTQFYLGQVFDRRYSISFDSQYSYTHTGTVSGTVTIPNGLDPTSFQVEVYVYTDIAYFMERVNVQSGRKWTTSAGVNQGNKIAYLVGQANTTTQQLDPNNDTGQDVENVYLAETYVHEPSDGNRPPRSYNVFPSHTAFSVLRYRTFVYDLAMLVIYLAANGFETEGQAMCNRLLDMQQTNKLLESGHFANQDNNDRFVFSAPCHSPRWKINGYYRTGAEMWAIYALLFFVEKFPANGDAGTFKTQAKAAMDALISAELQLNDSATDGKQFGCFRGGKGAYTTSLDEENNQLVYTGFDDTYVVGWSANEHMCDAYWALKKMHEEGLGSATNRVCSIQGVGSGVWKSAHTSTKIFDLTTDQEIEVVMGSNDKATRVGFDDAATPPYGSQAGLQLTSSGEIKTVLDNFVGDEVIGSYEAGDKIKIKYVNSTDDVEIYKNGSKIHTLPDALAGHGNQNLRIAFFHEQGVVVNIKVDTDGGGLEDITLDELDNDVSTNEYECLQHVVGCALRDINRFWNNSDGRGNRGITDSTTIDNCHALDNMTWYSIALFDMAGGSGGPGDITDGRSTAGQQTPYEKGDNALNFILNTGDDANYDQHDNLFDATSIVTYVGNNGCYQSPEYTGLIWPEGAFGYVLARKARGDNNQEDDGDAITNWKEVAKIARKDGIPYNTRSDDVYELQPWGSLIAACWAELANKPNGFWDLSYSQLVTK